MKLIYSFSIVALLTANAVLAWEPLPAHPPVPADNPMSPEKIELGKMLYFDPRLSRSGNISCNSCHNVMGGGDDNRAFSLGFKASLGGRSSPTVWNAAFQSVQFWDGRAATLEEQAKGPLTNPVEMAMKDHDAVITERIDKVPGYRDRFQKVFGRKHPISIENAVKAIAAYERTLITPNSPLDRFVRGDKTALSPLAKKGMAKFQSVGCISCHSGRNFSGPALPAGEGFYMKFPTYPDEAIEAKYQFTKDRGRADVTKNDADAHLFRVPTLRNIALTAPYFHNGSVPTLEEAVRVMGKLQLNRDLSEEDIAALVEFLKSLTGEFPKQTLPRLPETGGTTLLTQD